MTEPEWVPEQRAYQQEMLGYARQRQAGYQLVGGALFGGLVGVLGVGAAWCIGIPAMLVLAWLSGMAGALVCYFPLHWLGAPPQIGFWVGFVAGPIGSVLMLARWWGRRQQRKRDAARAQQEAWEAYWQGQQRATHQAHWQELSLAVERIEDKPRADQTGAAAIHEAAKP
jgi:hypothetical protein